MDEVSSDSNDTIIALNAEESIDVDSILRKYANQDVKYETETEESCYKNNEKHRYDLSEFSDEDICVQPLEKRLKRRDSPDRNRKDEDDDLLKDLYAKYMPKNKPSCSETGTVLRENKNNVAKEKTQDKLAKELAREAKKQERVLKKQKSEQEKAEKNAQKFISKTVNPNECTKYITVNIDENLEHKEFWNHIKKNLENSEYKYKLIPQNVPNSITWIRKLYSIETLLLKETEQKEKIVLLIMELREFLELVHKNTLTRHLETISLVFEAEQIFLTVLGLEVYYSYLKKKSKSNIRLYEGLPKIGQIEVEMALIDLQITYKKCKFRPVESYEDLAMCITQCTKSVAQIPFKSMNQEKHQNQRVFLPGVNKNCVKVDKDGNGLTRLWNQMLTMFPNVSLEVAEAISSVYPTFSALNQAYKNCTSEAERETLLKDLPIRRSAGTLSNVKKVGPVLSKKAYIYFCSEVDNFLVGK